MARQGVEYAAEVADLRRAIEGVRELLGLRVEDALTTEERWRSTAVSTSAVLVLVSARLSMLEQAFRGSLDPQMLLTEANAFDHSERRSLEGSLVSAAPRSSHRR